MSSAGNLSASPPNDNVACCCSSVDGSSGLPRTVPAGPLTSSMPPSAIPQMHECGVLTRARTHSSVHPVSLLPLLLLVVLLVLLAIVHGSYTVLAEHFAHVSPASGGNVQLLAPKRRLTAGGAGWGPRIHLRIWPTRYNIEPPSSCLSDAPRQESAPCSGWWVPRPCYGVQYCTE